MLYAVVKKFRILLARICNFVYSHISGAWFDFSPREGGELTSTKSQPDLVKQKSHRLENVEKVKPLSDRCCSLVSVKSTSHEKLSHN